MKADAMATRIAVLTRALPMRILLVDDDELELELIAGRLSAAGFEVQQAANGAEALGLIEQTWFPLVITDWQMPVMDGITFGELLRARGIRDTYVIMLTSRGESTDYERGYAAGIDDYLTKNVPDAELFARINVAFNTIALRRSLQEARDALQQSTPIDPDSGAFAPGELQRRLHSEIRRAERYGRPLSIINVEVRPRDESSVPLTPEFLQGITTTLGSVIRAHVDWIGRIGAAGENVFAVVLPEAGIVDDPAIKDRLLAALERFADAHGLALQFSCGVAALERDRTSGGVEPDAMLDVAEHCRRCDGRMGSVQLAAVKKSVARHVAIPCRHGYAVASECPLRRRAEEAILASS